MSWREEWETKGYIERLTNDGSHRLRVRLRVEKGTVTRFVAQYEAMIDGIVYPVVRYDTAHDYAHRDTLDRSGREIAKVRIAGPDRFAWALTIAIRDLKTNWSIYFDEFMRRTS